MVEMVVKLIQVNKTLIRYVVLTPEFIYPYRNQGGFDMICSGRDKIETPDQFKQAEEAAVKLDLDGLVVIGGDDSNTHACLTENFSCSTYGPFCFSYYFRVLCKLTQISL